jgi:hypothetical protein
MAIFNGYVTVYESSDGGSGDPNETIWQFFIFDGNKNNPVTTRNHRLARTMRLAIETYRRVRVTCGDDDSTMSQARIEFERIGPPG